ncbi:hypothetical protein PHLGIDRAFT_31496 [Phlebiopsis gigantea 11061_1 CR5-6]|uniref:S15/NS1 RNA-binding domain-containing protein n=1 Tax=Phlebiopsis gigantea (strain 11061_1 CR5-6) TaxID=745531 RepID=A0A0C3PF52_PHLG1|nr:hypothetical protein PHLGIDRAFT_31496 [Phlebiopsis gigantea 11061_1 CR5-6]
MLSARFAQSSRLVASTSTAPAATFHSSSLVYASLDARRQAKLIAQQRKERAEKAELNRPHVVLGHKPGDEAKWANCDLAKILVTEQDVLATPQLPPTPRGVADLPLPHFMNYGVRADEKAKLFETLPVLTAEAEVKTKLAAKDTLPQDLMEMAESAQSAGEKVEFYKAGMLARIIDLRNANARGLAYENRQRCVAAFSEPGKPNDTGRPEVQAAILTMRIRNVWDHLMKSRKDVASRRSLRTLVHQRQKILKYLKRLDRDRYDICLERLGLEPAAVEDQLIV